MATSKNSLRPWREIAKEASEEHNPINALQLTQELIRALHAESRKHMEHVTPDTKAEVAPSPHGSGDFGRGKGRSVPPIEQSGAHQ